MGKGDRKTKRGKIIIGSYGNTRMRKKKSNTAGMGQDIEKEKTASEK